VAGLSSRQTLELVGPLVEQLRAAGWWLRRQLESHGPGARRFEAWASANAIHLEPAAVEPVDVERLAPLDGHLADKRIIYLAESDHFIHETHVFRQLLTPYLFSRGWRWIGEELGASDGGRIDQYLATGDESWLDRVAMFGYRDARRTDRDDTPTGLLRDAWGPSYPQAAMKAEQVSRLRKLRRLSEARPPGTSRLRFFGFDIDAAVGGGYEDVNGLLSPHREDSRIRELASALERVGGESAGEELARLERVLQHMQEHRPSLEEALGAGTYEALLSSVLSLRDSLKFVAVAHPATDWPTVAEAMAEREEAMFQRVRRVLSRLGPGEKVILQGHAAHLSKDWPSVRQLSVWAGPPKQNLGTRLLAEYPGQVFSIWMVHGRGRSAQPFTSLPSELHLVPGTLNALLARVGACFLLPTTGVGAEWLSRERELTWMYNGLLRTPVARQADALFFVRTVGPLRLHAHGDDPRPKVG
jgi:erythromycin esterase-like protein